MPIFKLKCRQCGNIFEYFFKNTEETAVCGNCNSTNLEKLPSQISVISNTVPACPNAAVCPGASPCCCNGKCGGHR
ncbi:MAG: hypothetical protein IKA22_12460 [Lentisphaeria bacterium]|nr:hypothetical protein [Lentisphaeria bacterium]